MDDFAGILVLLALVALAVPLLLVMALVKIGNAKARVDALERDVEQLHGRLRQVASARAAPPTSSLDTVARAQPSMAAAPPARAAETWRDGAVPADSGIDAIKRDPVARDGGDAGTVFAGLSESDPAYPGASASPTTRRKRPRWRRPQATPPGKRRVLSVRRRRMLSQKPSTGSAAGSPRAMCR